MQSSASWAIKCTVLELFNSVAKQMMILCLVLPALLTPTRVMAALEGAVVSPQSFMGYLFTLRQRERDSERKKKRETERERMFLELEDECVCKWESLKVWFPALRSATPPRSTMSTFHLCDLRQKTTTVRSRSPPGHGDPSLQEFPLSLDLHPRRTCSPEIHDEYFWGLCKDCCWAFSISVTHKMKKNNKISWCPKMNWEPEHTFLKSFILLLPLWCS